MLLSVHVARAPGIALGRRSRSSTRLRLPERVLSVAAPWGRRLIATVALAVTVPIGLIFVALAVLPVAPLVVVSSPLFLFGLRGDRWGRLTPARAMVSHLGANAERR